MWGNSYVDKAYWKGVRRMTKFCLNYRINMFNPVFLTETTNLLIFVNDIGDFLTCHLDYFGLLWRLTGLVKMLR